MLVSPDWDTELKPWLCEVGQRALFYADARQDSESETPRRGSHRQLSNTAEKPQGNQGEIILPLFAGSCRSGFADLQADRRKFKL